MDTKGLLTSKTFWFNVITTAISVAGVLPPKYGAIVAGVGNVLLRILTNTTISGL